MSKEKLSQSDKENFSSALPNVAIVAEGGGQRGIYTAGVLDTFLDHQFNPFLMGLGVSAGAQNLLTYFMGERGYAKRAISELTAAPGFFVPYRWLGARGVIDLDQYFDATVLDPEYQLPYQRISKVQRNRQLTFVATNRETLEPVYLEPDKNTVLNYLKASSAVPFLYRSPITINGEQLVDGGVSDPLPILKALDAGAKHIVVIRTVDKETVQSSWRQRVDALPIRRALPAVMLNMLEIHEAAYSRAIDAMRSPPDGVQIYTIAPEHALRSHAFGSSSDSIIDDYEQGRSAGLQAITRLKASLAAKQGNKAKKEELA